MYTQFTAGLGARPKQAKTIAIQHRIDNLGIRYYDGVINVMEYLDGLSLVVAKRKKWHYIIHFFCLNYVWSMLHC